VEIKIFEKPILNPPYGNSVFRWKLDITDQPTQKIIGIWQVLKNSRGWQITSETASILPHWRHQDLSDARPFLLGRTWNWAHVRASSGPKPLKLTTT